MKKLCALFLVCLFCLSVLLGCSEPPECQHTWKRKGYADMHTVLEICLQCEATRTVPDPDMTTMDEATVLKLYYYNYEGYGYHSRKIEGEVAAELIAGLKSLTFTGEIEDEISDETFSYEHMDGLDTQIQFIEVGNCIFRATSGFEQICRVETHLGKGYVLNVDEALQTALREAKSYYPYDYYTAISRYGNITKFVHVYHMPSTIRVDAMQVSFSTNSDKETENRITLYLTSSVDQTIEVSMFQQSGDVVGMGADETMATFEKGISQRVDLFFEKEGFRKEDGPLRITVDNTRIYIAVK